MCSRGVNENGGDDTCMNYFYCYAGWVFLALGWDSLLTLKSIAL
jgi:hypothetical protein